VAAVGGEARDRDHDRRPAEPEFLADGPAVAGGAEARQVGGAGDPVHALAGQSHLATACLDLA